MKQIGSKGCWVFWDMLTHMIFETFPSDYCSPGTSQWKTQTKTANLNCTNANMKVCIKLSKSDRSEDKAVLCEIWESCDGYAHEFFHTYTQLFWPPSNWPHHYCPSPSLEHELEKTTLPTSSSSTRSLSPTLSATPSHVISARKGARLWTPLLENLLPLPRWQLSYISIKHIVKDISIHLGFQEVWGRKKYLIFKVSFQTGFLVFSPVGVLS